MKTVLVLIAITLLSGCSSVMKAKMEYDEGRMMRIERMYEAQEAGKLKARSKYRATQAK